MHCPFYMQHEKGSLLIKIERGVIKLKIKGWYNKTASFHGANLDLVQKGITTYPLSVVSFKLIFAKPSLIHYRTLIGGKS